MKADGGFAELMRNHPEFVSSLSCIVFDEAHCIIQWGRFREEYSELAQLRYQLPRIKFVFASATFAPLVLQQIKTSFGLVSGTYEHIRRSNNRPNIHLHVQKIMHPVSSLLDLGFLIPENWKEGDAPSPKFLILFNSIAEAVDAAKFLRRRLPPEVRDYISWFHSDMSSTFKEDEVEWLRKGEIWGLCTTDAFGLVSRTSHNWNHGSQHLYFSTRASTFQIFV